MPLLRLRLRRLRPSVRGRSTASTTTAADGCPLCGGGPGAQGVRRAGDPLQGLGLGEEGAPRDGRAGGQRRRTARGRDVGSGPTAWRPRRRRDDGRPTDGAAARRSRQRRESDALGQADGRTVDRRPRVVDRDATDAMPSAADWITLAEAQAHPGRRERPLHDRRRSAAGRAPAGSRASSSVADATSGAARSGR